MATRATYSFRTHVTGSDGFSRNSETKYVYLHHDGYPAGALSKIFSWFDRSLDISDETGEPLDVSFESFLAANPKAEVISDHIDHADTDYRYDIIFDNNDKFSFDSPIHVWEKRGKSWACISVGTIAEFEESCMSGQHWNDFLKECSS